MNKKVKNKILSGILAATIATTTNSCMFNNNDKTANNSSKPVVTSDISLSKVYKIVIKNQEFSLTETEYNSLVSEIVNNYNVLDNSDNESMISRTSDIALHNEKIELSEDKLRILVEKILANYNLSESYDFTHETEEELTTDTTVADYVSMESIDTAIDSISTRSEALTKENFEILVASFAKICQNNNLPVSTEDIVKFVAIANIDILAEENPELIRELTGVQMKEEFLNDAAKLIGAIVMDNFKKWNSTNSTDNFIKVSDIIIGSQKENMLAIEEYMNKIATAVNDDDCELVNSLANEFITVLNSGKLSKLDDGVGFVAQVYIATIDDGIGRNHLNNENRGMFAVLKSSEKYVSNIFTVYESCQNNSNGITR